MYKRDIFKIALKRLTDQRRFIQVLLGPRQVGKTTLAQQLLEAFNNNHYASADEPGLRSNAWVEQQWEIGRLKAKTTQSEVGGLLILDEIQKIPHWSDVVKKLWDQDTFNKIPLKVVLLGSAPLLMQQGLTESLAGRFENIVVTHWSYPEMNKAFGFNLEEYIYFGGYPGAAPLIKEEERWSHYVTDSLIETTISRDILLMTRVDKPALLRQLFKLSCDYSGQILSYQKMLGQLTDAGNTTTLAHYLQLLYGAGMVAGIEKFSSGKIRQRGSSPKLQVMNTALMSAQSHVRFKNALENPQFWGRLTESAVGAYLLNQAFDSRVEIFYWRERSMEVDFVLRYGDKIIAVEVKSMFSKNALPGMQAFANQFKPIKLLQVGGQGIPLKEFFTIPIMDLFS